MITTREITAPEVKLVEFFSTGSTLLDLALNGGWALRRVFNIVGDESTGKTLLAIEAFANFKRRFPTCRMRYGETEHAFDTAYARTMGFPIEVERPEEPLMTVEEFRDDLYKFVNKETDPGLYILDSLDALSDAAELEAFKKDETDKGSYGVGKAKSMSKLLRLLTGDIASANCSLGIISQTRDRIGITFGEKKTRSGGQALNFYASEIVWLSDLGKITRTVKNEDRPVGVNIRARVKKCKVGNPFREAEFPLIFGYGVDDEISMLDWLVSIKAMEKESAKDVQKQLVNAREKRDYTTLDEIAAQLKQDTRTQWIDMENALSPAIRKYR